MAVLLGHTNFQGKHLVLFHKLSLAEVYHEMKKKEQLDKCLSDTYFSLLRRKVPRAKFFIQIAFQ